MYEHADFTGWEAVFVPGEYDHARLEKHGAMNDDVEVRCKTTLVPPLPFCMLRQQCAQAAGLTGSGGAVRKSVVVGSGCSAVLAQHGEHEGWEATLSDKGGGKRPPPPSPHRGLVPAVQVV